MSGVGMGAGVGVLVFLLVFCMGVLRARLLGGWGVGIVSCNKPTQLLPDNKQVPPHTHAHHHTNYHHPPHAHTRPHLHELVRRHLALEGARVPHLAHKLPKPLHQQRPAPRVILRPQEEIPARRRWGHVLFGGEGVGRIWVCGLVGWGVLGWWWSGCRVMQVGAGPV